MTRREFNDLFLAWIDSKEDSEADSLLLTCIVHSEPILQCISDEIVRDFCALGDFFT